MDPLAGGLVDQLERLTRLHRDGDLTDEEFTLAKGRLLRA
ncbi:MAG: SHOCT domain-containing protein [Proteobacteria bacterium]|nr:SHOCT domain-containing protein [Pseudomonadota bacterium]MCP4919094.1 SHOCT domain-containing protein [Pseudomonadota bacterium]